MAAVPTVCPGLSGGSDQREGGAVVAWRRMLPESSPRIRGRSAERLGAVARESSGRISLTRSSPKSSSAVSVSHAHSHSITPAGNQQQSRTFLKSRRSEHRSGMGKQAKGKAGGSEFGDSGAVAEKPRRVSGIGVAERAEFLVVAGDEGGAGVNAAETSMRRRLMRRQSSVIASDSLMSGRRKQFGAEATEDLLSGIEDAAVVFAAPGDVQQTE